MKRLSALILVSLIASAPSMALAAGDAAKGAKVFARCQICHSVEPGKKASVGPNLAGVVGRKVGSTAFTYSAAMKSANFAWTTDKLDAFLKQPASVVKGTKMAFGGLPNPQDRADLTAFLATKK